MQTMALQSWGNLQLLRTYSPPIMAKRRGGGEYYTGEDAPERWVLRCECGHEFEIEADAFPGRRKLRDCGRTSECRSAKENHERRVGRASGGTGAKKNSRPVGRPRGLEPKTGVTVTLTIRELMMLEEMCRAQRVNRSRMVAELVRRTYGDPRMTSAIRQEGDPHDHDRSK